MPSRVAAVTNYARSTAAVGHQRVLLAAEHIPEDHEGLAVKEKVRPILGRRDSRSRSAGCLLCIEHIQHGRNIRGGVRTALASLSFRHM